MTIQQQASRMTREALASLFSAARHVPEDRRDWVPMGEARTVQGLLYECALTTPFYIAAAQGKMAEFASLVPDEATQELWRTRSEAASTLEGAESVARETYAELCQALEFRPRQASGRGPAAPDGPEQAGDGGGPAVPGVLEPRLPHGSSQLPPDDAG